MTSTEKESHTTSLSTMGLTEYPGITDEGPVDSTTQTGASSIRAMAIEVRNHLFLNMIRWK